MNVYEPFPLNAWNSGELKVTPCVVNRLVVPETVGGPFTVIDITV